MRNKICIVDRIPQQIKSLILWRREGFECKSYKFYQNAMNYKPDLESVISLQAYKNTNLSNTC
jgi:hypothetical protein